MSFTTARPRPATRAGRIQKVTTAQALAAYEAAGKRMADAARSCGVHPQTMRKVLECAGLTFEAAIREDDIPAQFMPMFKTCVAKVGRTEALRIIRDHIERRG